MIFDLSTREFFPIFNIWMNESALTMAPAPVNSTKAASDASLQFCRVRIASGVQFCFGHKSPWYPELPCNDVATKLQLTSFRLTLGTFRGIFRFPGKPYSARTTKKATTRNRGDERRVIWFLLLLFLLFLLLLNRQRFSWCKCRELQAVQRRQQRFCKTLWILNFALSAICSSNATNELN